MESKSSYEKVELEVIEFEAADVVTASPEGDIL
jgi:hypothetical protein